MVNREDMDLSLLTILSSAPGPLPPLALRLAVQMDSQISGASDKVPPCSGENGNSGFERFLTDDFV